MESSPSTTIIILQTGRELISFSALDLMRFSRVVAKFKSDYCRRFRNASFVSRIKYNIIKRVHVLTIITRINTSTVSDSRLKRNRNRPRCKKIKNFEKIPFCSSMDSNRTSNSCYKNDLTSIKIIIKYFGYTDVFAPCVRRLKPLLFAYSQCKFALRKQRLFVGLLFILFYPPRRFETTLADVSN